MYYYSWSHWCAVLGPKYARSWGMRRACLPWRFQHSGSWCDIPKLWRTFWRRTRHNQSSARWKRPGMFFFGQGCSSWWLREQQCQATQGFANDPLKEEPFELPRLNFPVGVSYGRLIDFRFCPHPPPSHNRTNADQEKRRRKISQTAGNNRRNRLLNYNSFSQSMNS